MSPYLYIYNLYTHAHTLRILFFAFSILIRSSQGFHSWCPSKLLAAGVFFSLHVGNSHTNSVLLFSPSPFRSTSASKRVKTSVSPTLQQQLLPQQQQKQQQIQSFQGVTSYESIPMPPSQVPASNPRKRRSSPPQGSSATMATAPGDDPVAAAPDAIPRKKGRTNTPWTAEEEQRLKTMRDAGRSWSEIAKVRDTHACCISCSTCRIRLTDDGSDFP